MSREAKKLAVSRSGYRRSRGLRLSFTRELTALHRAQEPAVIHVQSKRRNGIDSAKTHEDRCDRGTGLA